MGVKVKKLKDNASIQELNRFRFEVTRRLARGRITTKEAKELLGVQTAINQAAVYVGSEDREYVRVKGMVSSLAH